MDRFEAWTRRGGWAVIVLVAAMAAAGIVYAGGDQAGESKPMQQTTTGTATDALRFYQGEAKVMMRLDTRGVLTVHKVVGPDQVVCLEYDPRQTVIGRGSGTKDETAQACMTVRQWLVEVGVH